MHIEKENMYSSLFRLGQKDEEVYVLALVEDDSNGEYWIADDVTELFDTAEILKLCEKEKDVKDVSSSFTEWWTRVKRELEGE